MPFREEICIEEAEKKSRAKRFRQNLPVFCAAAAGTVLLTACLLFGKALLPNETASPAVDETDSTVSQTLFAANAAPSYDASSEAIDASAISEQTQPNETGESVFVTVSGTKYHRAGCSYLRATRIEMPLAQAFAEGYAPCSRCNP